MGGAPDLFAYSDYRTFLRDVVKGRKLENSKYSLSHLAKSLGFSSHSGLAMVLNGNRSLRSPYLDKCIRHLKLNLKQQLYFEALVRAGKISSVKKRALLRELQFYNSMWETPNLEDGIRLIDLGIVQQVMSLRRCHLTLSDIHRYFRYPLEKAKIQEILDWLVSKEYAESSPLGYRIINTDMIVQDEKVNTSMKQFHKDCLQFATSALYSDSLDRREFQTYMVTMDTKKIGAMKERIKKFTLELINEFESELESDTIVQFHFNLFEMIHQGDLSKKGKQDEKMLH